MIATALGTAVIAAASVVAGQALLRACGRLAWTWLSGPVGLALLLALGAILIRATGDARASAIVLAALVLVAAVYLRGRTAGTAGALALAVPAALLAGLLAALPFIASGRVGILGMGLVNDDMASHLVLADWLATGTGEEPTLAGEGYPLGPHSLVAVLSAGLGIGLVEAFAALTLALPVLTALVALEALRGAPPPARIAIAALVALPYLAAAYLAQGAFKEPLQALLLLGFALLLPGAFASPRAAVPLGVLAAGSLYNYSFPGLAWLVGAAAVWALLILVERARHGERRPAIRPLLAPAAAAIGAALVLSAASWDRLVEFIGFRAFDPGEGADIGLGNLRGHLSPLEALGIWPSSEFRLAAGAGELPAVAFYAAAAVAALALALGLVRWTRAHGPAVPAALGAAALIYVGARGLGTVYTSAKALAIAAPLVALVALGGLLASGRARWRPRVQASLAVLVALGIAGSSFLVLRQAPVGPLDHLDQLGEIRPHVAGEDVLFLGRDNFVLYGLHGARPHTHAVNHFNPYEAAPHSGVERSGVKFDFDALDGATTLAGFPYVLTTRGAYASGPPPGYEAVVETASYVLWRRGGDPRGREPVEKGLAPAARLECRGRDRPPPGARAAWLPRRPVATGAEQWAPSGELEDGAAARVALELPPGDWELSLQYDATASLTLSGDRLEADLPAFLGYRGSAPSWPAGRVRGHPGGPLEISVEVAPPPLAGRVLGARSVAHLGTIAATPLGGGYGRPGASATAPFPGSSARLSAARRACGRYADWVEGG